MCASRQHVRAYRRTETEWRRKLLVGAVVALPHTLDQLGVGRGQFAERSQYGVEPALALRRHGVLVRTTRAKTGRADGAKGTRRTG